MNKISQEDIQNLFKTGEPEVSKNASNNANDFGMEKEINYRRYHKKFDEVKIKKIKKQINKITLPEKKGERSINAFLWFCFYAGLVGFVLFGALNFGAFKDRFNWFYFNDYLGQPIPNNLPKITDEVKKDDLSAPSLAPGLSTSNQPEGLRIEKISLTAPIIWNVEEADILENLKNGVVHYKGTSLPGEGGNVFITGHSSNYFWIQSDYNQVFALLDKLDKSDRITINYKSKIYTYEVVEKKVVEPNQVEVLNSTKNEVLTLMTCWPIGTSLNRLVVQAQLLFVSSL